VAQSFFSWLKWSPWDFFWWQTKHDFSDVLHIILLAKLSNFSTLCDQDLINGHRLEGTCYRMTDREVDVYLRPLPREPLSLAVCLENPPYTFIAMMEKSNRQRNCNCKITFYCDPKDCTQLLAKPDGPYYGLVYDEGVKIQTKGFWAAKVSEKCFLPYYFKLKIWFLVMSLPTVARP